MNTQLIESIYQVIQSLSDEERLLLEEKLYTNIQILPYPSQKELIALAEASNVFYFLHDELNFYSLLNDPIMMAITFKKYLS
ncbi:hypothetical protein NIES4102_18530 [Chondrocystis sp. NIES-4102]|nr:hypothetical protein NIES4102_18530 [Chondrocystis sp. NIES-4102]